jgi:hypothetical protein
MSKFTKFKIGDKVVFKSNEKAAIIYTGENLGIHPYYVVCDFDGGGDDVCAVISRPDGSGEEEGIGYFESRFEHYVYVPKVMLSEELFND